MRNAKDWLEGIMLDLRATDDHEVQANIGRSELSSLLHQHSREILDDVIKLARRDNRMRRALGGARYYSGLGRKEDVCKRIDEVLKFPFPGAVPKGRHR
jgi:hypothetical protein